MGKVVKLIEQVFGAENVMPNQHLHAHLSRYIRLYGPVMHYWGFHLERMCRKVIDVNTNHKDVETQMARAWERQTKACIWLCVWLSIWLCIGSGLGFVIGPIIECVVIGVMVFDAYCAFLFVCWSQVYLADIIFEDFKDASPQDKAALQAIQHTARSYRRAAPEVPERVNLVTALGYALSPLSVMVTGAEPAQIAYAAFNGSGKLSATEYEALLRCLARIYPQWCIEGKFVLLVANWTYETDSVWVLGERISVQGSRTDPGSYICVRGPDRPDQLVPGIVQRIHKISFSLPKSAAEFELAYANPPKPGSKEARDAILYRKNVDHCFLQVEWLQPVDCKSHFAGWDDLDEYGNNIAPLCWIDPKKYRGAPDSQWLPVQRVLCRWAPVQGREQDNEHEMFSVCRLPRQVFNECVYAAEVHREVAEAAGDAEDRD